MRVLVTVCDMTRVGIVVDLESGETRTIPGRPEFIDSTVVGRAACRPFGITWNQHELFIANNRQLLVFNKQLDFVRILPDRLQINVHQSAYSMGRVWTVSPWTNSLIGISRDSDAGPIEFDLASQDMRPYVEREGIETDDIHHYNSLLWSDGYLFVAAHCFGNASFINQYDADTWRLCKTYRDVGASIHNLACYQGELYWISTGTREIRSNSAYSYRLSRRAYVRGLAMTEEYFIVAISELLARGERHAGDSWIQVIDRIRGAAVREIYLADTGSINDLRLLDKYDYAHCVQPFWVGSHE